jgi:hypothetical protein
VDDKLMTEAQLREQNRMLVALVGDLATILDEVLTALPPEFHELPNVQKSMALTRNINTMLRAMPKTVEPTQPVAYSPAHYLMSGRWRRRDGDVYGIVRQPGVRLTPEADNGDNPPRDLRSTD